MEQTSLFELDSVAKEGYENATVPLSQIQDTTAQPSASLLASMKELGMFLPVVLQADPAEEDKFVIVAGRRRIAAARLLSKKMDAQDAETKRLNPVKAVVIPEGADPSAFTLLENYAREDNPGLDFLAVWNVMQKEGATIELIAKELHLPVNKVKRLCRYTGLISALRDAFGSGKIRPGIALQLAKWPKERQEQALGFLVSDGKITGDHLKAILAVGAPPKVPQTLNGLTLPPGSATATPLLGQHQIDTIRGIAESLKSDDKKFDSNDLKKIAEQLLEITACSPATTS